MLRLNLWTFARTCFFPNTMITRAQMAKFSSVNIQVTHHKSDNEFSVIIGNGKQTVVLRSTAKCERCSFPKTPVLSIY